MDNKKLLSGNIWRFYLITALGIRFIVPIRILYLLSFGLSFAQIGIMELAASIAIVILEVPTGIFADMFGRKKAMLVAYVLSIIAFSFMSFGSIFPIFILGWALSGAADAFQSGAQDALIFDTLKELNREKDYLKIKSQFIIISTVSVIAGSLIGAYLYSINTRLPWYLITITIILSSLIFISIKEPNYIHRMGVLGDRLKEFKTSLISSLSNTNVRWLIAFGLILALPMFVFTTLLNQPYLVSRGFNIRSLGIIFAVITGLGGLVASFTHKIEPMLKQRLSFLLIIISFMVLLILLGVIHNSLVLVLVIGFYIVDNFKSVIIDNYLNQAISSESRATVLSVQSLVNNIFISILFVFVGYLVDIFSIDFVLISLGVFIGLSCIPLWLSLIKEK